MLHLNDNNLVVDLRDPKTLNLTNTISARTSLGATSSSWSMPPGVTPPPTSLCTSTGKGKCGSTCDPEKDSKDQCQLPTICCKDSNNPRTFNTCQVRPEPGPPPARGEPTYGSDCSPKVLTEGSITHNQPCTWSPDNARGGCGKDKLGVPLQCVTPGGKNYVGHLGHSGTCQCPLRHTAQYPITWDVPLGCYWGYQYSGPHGSSPSSKVCTNPQINGEPKDPEGIPYADKSCQCPRDWWDVGTGPPPFGDTDGRPIGNGNNAPSKLMTCDGYPAVCIAKYSKTGVGHNESCGDYVSSDYVKPGWYDGNPVDPGHLIYCERGGCGSDQYQTKYQCKKNKCSCPEGCHWTGSLPKGDRYCRKNGTKHTNCPYGKAFGTDPWHIKKK